MKEARIGCSGFSYDSWRGDFYPQGVGPARWLEHYASVFDTVEINATFYRLPKPGTVAGWTERTPAGFLFAIKASRYLTHVRRLRDIGLGLRRFWEPLEPMRAAGKLGAVLWQLPETFKRDDEALASLLGELPPARHAFEFRHRSWFVGDVRACLEDHGASIVIAHDARRELPVARATGPMVYLRLHYGAAGRRGNYSGPELARWRRSIAAWRTRREVLAYLNNDWEGFAPRNARELRAGLSDSRRR